MEEKACCAAQRDPGRKKVRTPEEKAALLLRLRKAEGQVRGIQKMVENDAWCADIVTQVAAVTNALNGFNRELLSCHIRSCVAEDLKARRTQSADELADLIRRLMK